MSGVEIGATGIFLGDILAGVGTAVSIAGALGQAGVASANARYSADVAESNAAYARSVAAAQVDQSRRNALRVQQSARAGYAKAGVEPTGTPLDVAGDIAQEAELEARNIFYGGEVASRRGQNEAAIYRYQGRAAQAAGYLGAGASLLTGVSRIGAARGIGRNPLAAYYNPTGY